MSNNPYTGSSFDDFLKEEELYEECSAIAVKRVLARQLIEKMQQQQIAKPEMALKFTNPSPITDQVG